ncbi:hypothetical protein HS088_TW09G01025 [Tripterygium wilfordii]|uniref:Serine-rich protein-related n=1 Tax=Tripterygium wilfordii TaxID=458696 RepID=A0A7J7D9E3_TRIWF|nr:hypothetical protein HS088_TW09G01025 [Tripterygium wilfordii]
MASDGSNKVTNINTEGNHKGEAMTVVTSTSSSPKGQCLCSPTTHQGSFRCRFHRSNSSAWMKRSNSMPSNNSST